MKCRPDVEAKRKQSTSVFPGNSLKVRTLKEADRSAVPSVARARLDTGAAVVQRGRVLMQRGEILHLEACLLLRCQVVFMRLRIGAETQAHLPDWEGYTHAYTVISTLTRACKHIHSSLNTFKLRVASEICDEG